MDQVVEHQLFEDTVVKGPTDEDGMLNVIVPGYSDNKHGYWICKESRTKDGGYQYTKHTKFFVKQDETNAQYGC